MSATQHVSTSQPPHNMPTRTPIGLLLGRTPTHLLIGCTYTSRQNARQPLRRQICRPSGSFIKVRFDIRQLLLRSFSVPRLTFFWTFIAVLSQARPKNKSSHPVYRASSRALSGNQHPHHSRSHRRHRMQKGLHTYIPAQTRAQCLYTSEAIHNTPARPLAS